MIKYSSKLGEMKNRVKKYLGQIQFYVILLGIILKNVKEFRIIRWI